MGISYAYFVFLISRDLIVDFFLVYTEKRGRGFFLNIQAK